MRKEGEMFGGRKSCWPRPLVPAARDFSRFTPTYKTFSPFLLPTCLAPDVLLAHQKVKDGGNYVQLLWNVVSAAAAGRSFQIVGPHKSLLQKSNRCHLETFIFSRHDSALYVFTLQTIFFDEDLIKIHRRHQVRHRSR